LGVATVDAAPPSAQAPAEPPDTAEAETETTQPAETVQGQVLREMRATVATDVAPPWQGLLVLLVLLAGFVHQARRARPTFRIKSPKGKIA
jgi:MYXO-CTERM domain-containing protein